jgi:aspartate beta-hydroxylase
MSELEPNKNSLTLSDAQMELALRLVTQIRETYPPESLLRLEAYFETVLTHEFTPRDPAQAPGVGYFPGLRAKRWWSAADAPSLAEVDAALVAGAPLIREELVRHVGTSSLFKPYEATHRYESMPPEDWASLMLYRNREFSPVARTSFPKTVEVLRPIVRHVVGEAVFLRLNPGASLPLHTDGSNAEVSCHLGVVVPPDCALEVGGETRSWEAGKTLYFDHSYPHRAWNRSREARYILLLDLAHPDMTQTEIDLLFEVQKALDVDT